MPIYKLSTSTLSASVRRSQPTPSDAVSVGAKANGDVVVSENRGHDKDNLCAQRPSPAEVGTRRCYCFKSIAISESNSDHYDSTLV